MIGRQHKRLYFKLKDLVSPENELIHLFEGYGIVEKLNYNKEERYGYLEYESKEDAIKAIRGIDKSRFIDKVINVEYALCALNKKIKKNKPAICFNCGQRGHIIIECRESDKKHKDHAEAHTPEWLTLKRTKTSKKAKRSKKRHKKSRRVLN